jgi:hypothetical protein
MESATFETSHDCKDAPALLQAAFETTYLTLIKSKLEPVVFDVFVNKHSRR